MKGTLYTQVSYSLATKENVKFHLTGTLSKTIYEQESFQGITSTKYTFTKYFNH